MIKKAGIDKAPYDHAAMLAYIQERYQGDFYSERGTPIQLSDWETTLLIKARWARAALERLEKAGLILVRSKMDQGKRTNRYISAIEVVRALDPEGLSALEMEPGVTTYRTARSKQRVTNSVASKDIG